MGGIKEEKQAMMVTADTWHKRLGHASDGKLSRVNSLRSFSFENKACDSCIKAKFARLPFPVSSIKSKECFDLVHCDIWGAYRTPSLSRATYFFNHYR